MYAMTSGEPSCMYKCFSVQRVLTIKYGKVQMYKHVHHIFVAIEKYLITVLCLISGISNFEPNPWMELNQISPAPNIFKL